MTRRGKQHVYIHACCCDGCSRLLCHEMQGKTFFLGELGRCFLGRTAGEVWKFSRGKSAHSGVGTAMAAQCCCDGVAVLPACLGRLYKKCWQQGLGCMFCHVCVIAQLVDSSCVLLTARCMQSCTVHMHGVGCCTPLLLLQCCPYVTCLLALLGCSSPHVCLVAAVQMHEEHALYCCGAFQCNVAWAGAWGHACRSSALQGANVGHMPWLV